MSNSINSFTVQFCVVSMVWNPTNFNYSSRLNTPFDEESFVDVDDKDV